VITQCCIHELYLQGRGQQAAVDIAKTFERRKCNHREAIPGDECLSSVVGQFLTNLSPNQVIDMVAGDTNKHRYVIASQSQPLRAKLRSIPAVPIVHINRSVIILEPPSEATLDSKGSVSDILFISCGNPRLSCTFRPRRRPSGPR
jgi:U3 small nucleolar RNA-associated protein 23